MAEFRYYTKGGSSPQGKPRVYFTAHPDDYRFFENICRDITDRQNCAVYCLDPGVGVDEVEDYELRLGQMQLFAVPVTFRLLTKPNRAMDVDIPFAFKNHIPVLPLMQESGLDELFNKRFGDLQYLDKYNTDPTAIGYDEKLTKYLESVIVGDELAAKVRAAFDAYIFLSYRKKDRKYAQELMKLIHKNPMCRDIAIWYDEFLTPGENFNYAIEAALKKSDLFALAVTPNLINEVNYVLTTEYPMAKEQGKDILPVEMEKTKRWTLKRKYKGIPEPVGEGDTEELARRLYALLRRVAVTANDSDPQHNFFIGLAYLSGIDVETDHEKAVGLITGAAKAGCTEAIEKLVSMYNTGEGVQRDYRKAIEWQEYLVKVLTEKYEKEPDSKKGYALLIALYDLGDFCYALRALEKAKSAYVKMSELSEDLYAGNGYGRFQRILSVSYNKLGDIARAQGRLNEAREYYEKGLEIREVRARETETAESKRDLSHSYGGLGDIARAQGKQNEARVYYEKALEISEALARETDTAEAKRDLSVGYIKLGDIARAQGKLNEAREYDEKALEIREALARETDTAGARRDLSVCYERLGDIARAQGRLNEAREYYEKELEICEVLARETGTAEAKRDLSISYSRCGGVSQAQGRLNEAREYYEKALEICEALARETETIEAKRDLSICYEGLGDIARIQGRLSEAQEYFEKALEIREVLARETGAAEAKRGLSLSYGRLGIIAEAQGRLSEAREYYERVLEISEALVRETGDPSAKSDLSAGYNKLGDIARAQGKQNEAREYYEKSLAIREAVARETETIGAKRDLSVCYERLGSLAEAQGRLNDAREYYEKALEILEVLARETETVQSYNDLAVSCYKLGVLNRDKRCLQKALDIWTKLSKRFPDNPSFKKRAGIAARALRSI